MVPLAVARLPNELIDCILENLYSDTTTLLNCALVGRAWLRSSQWGIFQKITLQLDLTHLDRALADAYLKAQEGLSALLAAKPHLASYVRLLHLQNIRGSIPDMQLSSVAVRVSRLLSNVKKLVLSNIRWNLTTPLLRAAVIDVLRSTSLTATILALSIDTFTELTSLLSQCNIHVKVLVVSAACSVWEAPSSSIVEVNATSHPRLRLIQLNELHLVGNRGHGIRSLMSWFRQDSCQFEIQNLQLLRVAAVPSSLTDSFLQYVGRNLRELVLEAIETDLNTNYLEHTPNLRSLTLSGLPGSTITAMILALFNPLLKQDGHRLPLQYLSISLSIIQVMRLRRRPQEWNLVDMLFAKPEFTLLETVNIKMAAYSDIQELLSEQLPCLKGSGKLRIELLDPFDSKTVVRRHGSNV